MARRTSSGDHSFTRIGKVRGREVEGDFAIIVRAESQTRIAPLRADGTADGATEELVASADVIDIKLTYRVPIGQRGAVIIPGDLRRDPAFQEGRLLQIVKEPDGRLTVTSLPTQTPEVILADLLEGVTPENIHGEIDTGRPVGREIW